MTSPIEELLSDDDQSYGFLDQPPQVDAVYPCEAPERPLIWNTCFHLHCHGCLAAAQAAIARSGSVHADIVKKG